MCSHAGVSSLSSSCSLSILCRGFLGAMSFGSPSPRNSAVPEGIELIKAIAESTRHLKSQFNMPAAPNHLLPEDFTEEGVETPADGDCFYHMVNGS